MVNLLNVATESISSANFSNTEKLAMLSDALEERQTQLDNVFLLISSFAILFMQAGFLMFEAGSVRTKNSRSIMFKNIVDACVCALMWYLFGFSVVSDGYPFDTLQVEPVDTTGWIVSYAFAATSCTIVSGGVAGRVLLAPYMLFSCIMCAIIYPMAAKWAWVEGQFLADMGYLDFAGSGVVHMIGGASAFVGAAVAGPRFGRFTRTGSRPIAGHSDVYVVIGTMILWFGWFFFNAASSGGTDPDSLALSNRAAFNTLLASFASGVVAVQVSIRFYGAQKLDFISSCVLAGLVGVTAPCAFISGTSAIVIGAFSVPVYMFGDWALDKLKVDDPVNATPVHFLCGAWGLLSCGLFHSEEGLLMTGKTHLMIAQVVGVLVMAAWSGGIAFLFFGILSKVSTIRCHRDDELVGLDFKYCDGYTYEVMDEAAKLEQMETKEAWNRMAGVKGGSLVSTQESKTAAVTPVVE